jgi:threonylcarbamoyladenosine tRNA methylthiotransferase MtaB
MKIYLDMVGCRLNQSEIEEYARQFRLAGHALVAKGDIADLIVINTCTVTAAAASDSRQKIRQAARTGTAKIIVTGCDASLNPQDTAAIQGVTQVIDNQSKENLVPMVLDLPYSTFEHASINREPIPGTRLRTRAFIKVQDGCDNHCTYCITALARGAARSRSIDDVLVDIQSALNGGSQEIVLTGVHLGSWGFDFNQPTSIQDLLKAILNYTDAPRLRLSSLEPWDITPNFFELWHDSRLCRHLHLPLQSGCAATLHRMGRKISPKAYAEVMREARSAIPGVAITTDIITGFPGETEAEFTESSEFVRAMNFANGHVFTFSPRPGTAAIHLMDKIPSKVGKQRNALMRQIFQHSANEYRQRFIGEKLSVLWEKAIPANDSQWQLSGLSDNYLRVRTFSTTPCRNQIMDVRIDRSLQDGLAGEISPEALTVLE